MPGEGGLAFPGGAMGKQSLPVPRSSGRVASSAFPGTATGKRSLPMAPMWSCYGVLGPMASAPT